jgi:putative NADH-flavin reductase
MSKILILGAVGSLGTHVVQQAISANHEVSVLVRSLSKLPEEAREKAVVYEGDLEEMPTSALAAIFQLHEVVINTAGYVAQGQTFTDLIDHLVTSLESIPDNERPVCWFLAGAALLDIDDSGRRGVDLPVLSSTYWPHHVNFDRIRQTTLDWRILCPGPMVDQPPVGLDRMRISLDQLPIQLPAFSRSLPEALALPFFTQHIPEMIIPYADAAALMLAHMTPYDEMSRHRVGLALPVGMRGEKQQQAAQKMTL